MSKEDLAPATGDTDGIEPAGSIAEADQLRARIEELEQKNLRLIADGRNLTQRALREKQEAIKYAEFDFAKELLSILDDLERTRESAKSGADNAAIVDGVRITHEHFLKLLKTRGIQQNESVGRTFDPSFHEALMQQPSKDVAVGSVIQEMQRGYTMHDRVLRPARVIISTGPANAGDRG